jgi:hypothetical protein
MIVPVESIAIIIPTRGDRDLTQLTAAINRQTRPANEILVVEDRLLRGSAWACNRGIESYFIVGARNPPAP